MSVDLNAAQELMNRMNYTKLSYLKLGIGKHKIRILPPPAGLKLPWLELLRSSNVGPAKGFVVPPSQFDPLAEDPLTDEIRKLEGLGDEASLKRAKGLKPKKVYPMFVIKRGEEAAGPLLWMASATTVRQLLQFILLPGAGDITSVEQGRDIHVVGVSKQGNDGKSYPSYSFTLDLTQTPLGNPDWILNEDGSVKDLFAMHKVAKPTEPDLIRAILEGTQKQWFEARKAARTAAKTDELDEEPEDSSEVPFEVTAPAAPKKNDDAVSAKLEEIRARTAKGESTTPASKVRQALQGML